VSRTALVDLPAGGRVGGELGTRRARVVALESPISLRANGIIQARRDPLLV
jgi:hypothetical protein